MDFLVSRIVKGLKQNQNRCISHIMNFNQLDLSLIKLNILISELHTDFSGFSLASLSIVILEICFGMLTASGILFVLDANVDK